MYMFAILQQYNIPLKFIFQTLEHFRWINFKQERQIPGYAPFRMLMQYSEFIF